MTDCPNADARDLLPDLINGQLEAADRRMVESHLEGCADCRAELALLGEVRAATRITPALPVDAIVAVLPRYQAPVRRVWGGWRVAAAITLLAAGASSLVYLRGDSATSSDTTMVARTSGEEAAFTTNAVPVPVPLPSAPDSLPSSGDVSPGTAVKSRLAVGVAAPVKELAMAGGSLTDLSDGELTSLLRDIEAMDALPSVDVESVSLAPLSTRGSTP